MGEKILFKVLEEINTKPQAFQYYTAEELWTDEHTSQKMLEYHLNENINVSSRNKKFIEKSVKWIVSNFGINSNSSICDFGCGPGLYTTRFAEKGAEVTGIDFSKRSIDYAKKTAKEKELNIEYVYQDYLTYDTDKRFDLITMIMCDYCALGPGQRKELLQKFYKLLKPDGSVLLDVYTLEAFRKREERSEYEVNLLNGFWSPERYYGFLNVFKYEEEKVVLDKYTIVEKDRIRTVYNWLQYFSPESLKEELEKGKFKVQNLFSDVSGSHYDPHSEEMAVELKKNI
jgi:2-polyprenyl-3-methyl-5-hydroxy-6-metoxy-1,4-benzoquinol methylase